MTEQLFGAADRHPQGLDGVASFGGRREVRGKHTFGRVVDHTADAPGAAPGGLELGEVHLPDAVATLRRGCKSRLARRREGAPLALVAHRQQEVAALHGARHAGGRDPYAVGSEHGPDLAMTPC